MTRSDSFSRCGSQQAPPVSWVPEETHRTLEGEVYGAPTCTSPAPSLGAVRAPRFLRSSLPYAGRRRQPATARWSRVCGGSLRGWGGLCPPLTEGQALHSQTLWRHGRRRLGVLLQGTTALAAAPHDAPPQDGPETPSRATAMGTLVPSDAAAFLLRPQLDAAAHEVLAAATVGKHTTTQL